MSDAPWLVAVFVAMSNREGGSEMNPELSSRIYPPPLVPDGYFLILVTAGRNSSHRASVPSSQRRIPQSDALPMLVTRAIGREYDTRMNGSTLNFRYAFFSRSWNPASCRVPFGWRLKYQQDMEQNKN
mmetsp:Transcript_27036/g.79900  ORF Transcript_27036/g.79900 Transcript_27036/m.79900 type:complete len:128 (-) Transcript_27036:156-539(-)